MRRTGVQFWYPFCECHAVRRILVDVTTLYGLLFRSSQSDGGLAFFDGGVGRVTPAVDGEGAAFERAVIDVEGDARWGDMKSAPCCGRAPETAMSGGSF